MRWSFRRARLVFAQTAGTVRLAQGLFFCEGENFMETTFIAPDIECAGCAASIQKALARQVGIQAVTVDVPAQRVTVAFDDARTGRAVLAEALTDIGFPPQPVGAA